MIYERDLSKNTYGMVLGAAAAASNFDAILRRKTDIKKERRWLEEGET
jgi:hypothetical protein